MLNKFLLYYLFWFVFENWVSERNYRTINNDELNFERFLSKTRAD